MKLGKLDNGATYCLRRREDVSSLSVQVWVSSGSANEGERTRGMSHFIEHMLFNGTGNFPAGYIESVVESLGGDINAATSYEYTYYYIHISSDHLSEAVELLGELVTNPKFTEEMVEKEKEIVLEEIVRSRDDPKELLWETYMKNMYAGSPYSHPILGYRETVSGFTVELVEDFYRRNYVPDNVFIVLCGNFDEERAEKLIKKSFAGFKGRKAGRKNAQKGKTGSFESEIRHPCVANPQAVLGWRLDANSIAYEVLESLLSLGKSSLLHQKIKEKGFAFSTYADYQNLSASPNFSIYSASNDIERFEEELKKVLESAINVERDEFEFAREKLMKSEIFERESVESEAESIGFSLSVYRDINLYRDYFKRLSELSFEEFRQKAAFLKRKPVKVKLLPANAG